MKNVRRTSIQRSFRVIQGIVCLLLVFLVIQGVMLWRVCNQGTVATRGLEQEALPSLRSLALLQENLAIYRLYSFELMFAQEQDRPAKLKQTETVQHRNMEIIQE